MLLGWDFSRLGMARVVLVTVLGTLGTMAVALVAVSYTTQFMTGAARTLTFASAVGLPLVMSAPIFYVFASKLRELALAHRDLLKIASQDSLTTCLNRGAFVTLVDAYLSQVNAPAVMAGGLLMVDADHFKDINDRFGHASGDEALQLIAGSIKRALRSQDLVGRIGGEEFAVFLPQTDLGSAERVAERIRTDISRLDFRPAGTAQPLSVSVGGAVFKGSVAFAELFKTADASLYEAKARGRNRVELATI